MLNPTSRLRPPFVALGLAGALAAAGCGRSGLPAGALDCPPGSSAANGACIADWGGAICGPGTQLVGNECLPIGVGGGGPGHPNDMGFGTDLAPANADLAPPPQGDRVTSWQIDPAHSGGQPNTALRPPLTRLWSYDTGGPVGYPLISDGRVFVTSGITGAPGTRLAAVDSGSGSRLWGPIALGGQYSGNATSAYDVALARLFVMNGDGLVQAFDPATGSVFWSKQLGAGFAGEIGPLVALAGLLFVPLEWSLTAVDGRTGASRWSGGEGASPMAFAVTPGAVYSCAVGGGVMASSPGSGGQIWLHQPSGDGGGGCFTVVGGGSVYAWDWADPPLMLDPASGAVKGGFSGPTAPAFDAGRAYFLSGPNLEAHDVATNTILWTFAGDGTLDTQPIAGGGYVYVGGSSGMLYALDGAGQVVYSDLLPSPLTSASSFLDGAPSGFAVAESKLFVHAGTILYAYTSD